MQSHVIREFIVKPSEGLQKTLEIMNELEGKAVQSDFFRNKILKEFEHLKYSRLNLFEKIWEYVRREFKYVDDRGDEEIKNPLLMFHYKAGDCDDFSLFIKTALTVLGIKSNYLLLGQKENSFTHIAVQTLRDGIIIDGTNELFNWIHPKYKHRKII